MKAAISTVLALLVGCAYSTQQQDFSNSDVTVNIHLPASAAQSERPIVAVTTGTQVATPVRSTPMDLLGITGSAAVGPNASSGPVQHDEQTDQSNR